MLIDQLHNSRDAILAAAAHYGAKRIRVFGSVVRGDDSADSDVDFLVEFPPGYDMFAQRLPLADRLSEIVGRPVDLIPEHELNTAMRPQVLAEALDL